MGGVERSAWIAFSEKVVAAVEEKRGKRGGSFFCYYHGHGDHGTGRREVIIKLEQQGWSCQRRSNGSQYCVRQVVEEENGNLTYKIY